jgi:sugar phosphate isomerase/epimerase
LPLFSTSLTVTAQNVDLLEKMPHLSLDPAQCDPAAVLAAARRHGLRVANLATYVGAAFASPNADEPARELPKVMRALDVAALLGTRSIRGFRGPQYDNAQDIPRLVPWIQRCCEYAERKGVYMGLKRWYERFSAM